MNETLQEFCQRILPVVQAGAEGKAIEAKAVMTGWERKAHPSFGSGVEYRVAKPKATPLPITPEMWAMIDPKYKWAYFQHGCIIFSASKPGWDDETRWFTSKGTGDFCELPLAINTTGIVPELSLTERPNDVGAEANHDDCQLLVVSSCGAKSPFQTALDEMCCCGVPDRLFKFLSNIPSK